MKCDKEPMVQPKFIIKNLHLEFERVMAQFKISKSNI